MSKSDELRDLLLMKVVSLVLELVPEEAMPGEPIFNETLGVVSTLSDLVMQMAEEAEEGE